MRRKNRVKLAKETPKNVHRVLSGKRISLPESFLRECKLSEGDFVISLMEGRSLRIVPADVVAKT